MNLNNFEAILRLCEDEVVEEFYEIAVKEHQTRLQKKWPELQGGAMAVSAGPFQQGVLGGLGGQNYVNAAQLRAQQNKRKEQFNKLLDNASMTKKKSWKWGK